MDTIIKLQDVRKTFKMGETTVEALRGVNLELERGGYYSIIGPSGSGKSSLLHIIGCMDVPTCGEVRVNGKRVSEFGERELTKIRAKDIGFIFQAFHLNPILTARENVSIALRFLGVSKKTASKRAELWLSKVGLADRHQHYPSELSGGERQRVAIARAMIKSPALILADEPTGNLDTQTGIKIVDFMRKINEEENTTIIQVTHDMQVAEKSDVIFVLQDGVIVEQRKSMPGRCKSTMLSPRIAPLAPRA
ncbi:MAG: ABC transporter ATP-binding protein [Chloroflexi bacterium]|nr:ABC transporter ATP-binding protein [Chloroflexota bacterium]